MNAVLAAVAALGRRRSKDGWSHETRRHGLGYTHFAIVKNECASAVACDLYSDVDPKSRHRALVPARETHEEALRRGSPSSAFKVGYRCEAQGPLATP